MILDQFLLSVHDFDTLTMTSSLEDAYLKIQIDSQKQQEQILLSLMVSGTIVQIPKATESNCNFKNYVRNLSIEKSNEVPLIINYSYFQNFI